MAEEVAKRVEDLARSISLLRATLDATADAILVVDGKGKVTTFNERFAAMWAFPHDALAAGNEARLLDLAAPQLKDPVEFLSKVRDLYAHPEAESFETLEFVDGRTFERYSKPQVLGQQVVGRVWSFRDVTERNRIEGELRFKSALLEAQVNCSNDGLLVVDQGGRKLLQNQRLTDLWKIPREIADNVDDRAQVEFVTSRTAKPQEFIEKVLYLYAHPSETSHDEIETVDGTILDRYSYPVVGADGTYFGRIWSFRDITHRKHMEDQLRDAQKMEAVGRLAGGIAHDFNNLLGIIRGQGELLAREVASSPKALHRLDQIGRATDRAATLTKQLLAFGRKQLLRPQRLDLNAVISGAAPMLRSLLGESIRVVIEAASSPVIVQADLGQVEHVLMSLAMNSRDAMPKGGRFVLGAQSVDVTAGDASRQPEIPPGSYATLTVSDTGAGMDAATRGHLFEPFFTTKPMGQGAGLGLAAIHGIVTQSNGRIAVESAPGKGTTFRVYLPRLESAAVAPPEPRPATGRGGGETILLVEDEPSLRELNAEILGEMGYQVLVAESGAHALAIAAGHAGPIDLLLADVVMPDQSGTDLARILLATRPVTKILYMSGYAGDDLVNRGVDATAGFIEKPFTAAALAQKVREALGT